MKPASIRLHAAALLLLMPLSAAASGQDEAHAALSRKSGIAIDHMDPAIRPGDDFFSYVNGHWLKTTDIPPDRGTYGTFEILQERANKAMFDIVAGLDPASSAQNGDVGRLARLVQSGNDKALRDTRAIEPLRAELARIDAIQNKRDLARYMLRAASLGTGGPIEVLIVPDFAQPSRYAMFLFQGGLGLPDRDFYLSDAEDMKSKRAAYRAYMERLLTQAYPKSAASAVDDILALETALARGHRSKEDNRDISRLYNPARKSLAGWAPEINWDALLEAGSVPQEAFFVAGQPEYLTELSKLVSTVPLDVWKDYFKWRLLDSYAPFLGTAAEDAHFSFHGKVMQGLDQPKEQWKKIVELTNSLMPFTGGRLYAERYFSADEKAHMLSIVERLLQSYRKVITSSWMSEQTKAKALRKIDTFRPMIGYPDKWRGYDGVTVDAKDLVGNVMRLREHEFARKVQSLTGPVDRIEWTMAPQTVNASYNPLLNVITFPAAILQPPFFDSSMDDAAIYGGIGAIIGHEIGHGFDDQGRMFDETGTMNEWWTPEEQRQFRTRTQRLAEQYNGFPVGNGVMVNGGFTLGENIGDLNGVSIALQAYRASLNGKPAPLIDGLTGEQRFFMGWAQAFMSKARPDFELREAASDPHAPARYRVNGVLRNIPDFYKAFDVKPGDKLYLPPEDRVSIW
ncbi:M13 family metallopeptidase [Sandaracinobacter neustonicus]|uniref:M13 family metallopeptidase n=1 Tax=Sandaracinobacter neustonicus TaxID=1715348 RepID=A0A501XFW7_9SPHN|nr:M13 family metallopeptidase [Sandaracinobacter neustonicus]TPE59511.1 M13 family metallopeptidase [Sandaracinobacter neustonicus]